MDRDGLTTEQRAIMARFAEHLETCTRCQHGPASMCPDGDAMAADFGGGPRSEVTGLLQFAPQSMDQLADEWDVDFDDSSNPQGGE